jgi:SAM-dependent methyltransferase
VYGIHPTYRAREKPEYYRDCDEWARATQPDVYFEAAAVARLVGARTIVDLGCGLGDKLVELADEFSIIGVDYGANIEEARARHEGFTWIEWDLDGSAVFELAEAREAVLVAADVIEHLVRPERLLRTLRRLFSRGALALVLSTPERDLVRGPDDPGPPANPCHVREWNQRELVTFLESEGMTGFAGLTRSNTNVPYFWTQLVVVPSSDAVRLRLEGWWRDRMRWQQPLAELQAQLLELEREVAAFRREPRADSGAVT